MAIDGSVFEHYPHFKNRTSDALREIFGLSADNITLALARDGSGVGAALIAAVMGKEELSSAPQSSMSSTPSSPKK